MYTTARVVFSLTLSPWVDSFKCFNLCTIVRPLGSSQRTWTHMICERTEEMWHLKCSHCFMPRLSTTNHQCSHQHQRCMQSIVPQGYNMILTKDRDLMEKPGSCRVPVLWPRHLSAILIAGRKGASARETRVVRIHARPHDLIEMSPPPFPHWEKLFFPAKQTGLTISTRSPLPRSCMPCMDTYFMYIDTNAYMYSNVHIPSKRNLMHMHSVCVHAQVLVHTSVSVIFTRHTAQMDEAWRHIPWNRQDHWMSWFEWWSWM